MFSTNGLCSDFIVLLVYISDQLCDSIFMFSTDNLKQNRTINTLIHFNSIQILIQM
jgi:hypothetical protein